MSKTVEIRGIKIGEGIPKVCVPIVGNSEAEIITAAEKSRDIAKDIIEWRADWFDGIFDYQKVLTMLLKLRDILGDTPIIFTFRTSNEGGEKYIDKYAYLKLIKEVISSRLVDLIDAELSMGEDVIKEIINKAHLNNIKVIVSNHDFEKTPDKETIVGRLQKMQEVGADIPKIAVMPKYKNDVITLLAATSEMNEKYADRPIITMSMGKTGAISRLCGEFFGSCITFGSVEKASAPGQINVLDLSKALRFIHTTLK